MVHSGPNGPSGLSARVRAIKRSKIRVVATENVSPRAKLYRTPSVTRKATVRVSNWRIVNDSALNGLSGAVGQVVPSHVEVDTDTSNDTVYMGLLAKDHPISVNVVTLNHVIRLMCALISTPSVPSGRIRDTARPSTSRGCRRTVQKHVENVPNRLTRARMSMMYHVQDGNSRASATLMPSRCDPLYGSNAKRAASFAK